MRSTGSLLAIAAVAVALSGCSAAPVTGAPAPTGGSSAPAPVVPATTDPVAWTDQVCGSLLPFVEATTTKPRFDPNNAGLGQQALSDYLGNAVTAIDHALAGLDAAGPAPVADGDAFVAKLKDALTNVRSSFAKAQTAIDKADPNNITELLTALPEALAPLLHALAELQDPTSGLKANPELEAAAAKAPNCQKINQAG